MSFTFTQGEDPRKKSLHTTSIQYPSGSRINAICLILPSVRRFLNGTPSRSKRAHASSTLATVIAMWPNPFESALPEWYGVFSNVSVPWLWVSSRIAEREKRAAPPRETIRVTVMEKVYLRVGDGRLSSRLPWLCRRSGQRRGSRA